MRSTIRTVLALAFAAALATACTGAAAPQAPASGPAVEAAVSAAPAPAATPVPTPKEITPAPPTPTPTPWPSTDAQGAEVVRGIETLTGLTTNYTSTRDGDVGRYRGGVLAFEDTMNDPRVSGAVTFSFGLDVYDKAGVEWGKVKIENDAGAWNGPCTGGSWSAGDGIAWSCWLAGSGAYDGYTYYRQLHKEVLDTAADVTGVVYPGKPPVP